MAKLTAAKLHVLRRLAEGEKIAHSQDGDCAWLFPSREWLTIDNVELDELRQDELIGDEPEIEREEDARFASCDVITTAGLAALEEEGR